MGRQHGIQEISDGKVVISTEREPDYRATLGNLRYGPHPIMDAAAVDGGTWYHQAALISGTPTEDYAHLMAVLDTGSRGENVDEIVALTGQRQRGIWGLPGEGSVSDLMNTVGMLTGTDMDSLSARSPWIRRENQRNGENWSAPFATEWEMFRLVGEASLVHLIDWDDYDGSVLTTEPIGTNEPINYTDQDQTVTVPPREHGMVTYNLINGQSFHVVNGAAVARPQGMPRATSASIAKEAMTYLQVPKDGRVVAVANAPHLRAAVDTAITYMDEGTGSFERFDVAASEWVPEVTNIVAVLGEIMATMKADFRLRAVLRGKDPNSQELLAI